MLGAAKSVIRRNACLLAASLICDRGGSCCRVVHIGREAGRMDKIIGDFFAFLVSCRSSYLYLDVVLGASGRRPTHTHTHTRTQHTHALTHAHGPQNKSPTRQVLLPSRRFRAPTSDGPHRRMSHNGLALKNFSQPFPRQTI